MIEDINTLTFDSFIQKIKTIKVYCSNAYKEYKVVKVNKTTLVLRDQRTKTDFEVPAAQIFCAMHELGIENCTVPKMRQYVGTHAAPASAALIFWAFRTRTGSGNIKKVCRFGVQDNKRTAKTEIGNLATCTVESASIDNIYASLLHAPWARSF